MLDAGPWRQDRQPAVTLQVACACALAGGRSNHGVGQKNFPPGSTLVLGGYLNLWIKLSASVFVLFLSVRKKELF